MERLSDYLEYYIPKIDHFIEKYEKNFFEIYEGLSTLVLDHDENRLIEETERIMRDLGLNDLSVETTVNALQKLIDGLKKNER